MCQSYKISDVLLESGNQPMTHKTDNQNADDAHARLKHVIRIKAVK